MQHYSKTRNTHHTDQSVTISFCQASKVIHLFIFQGSGSIPGTSGSLCWDQWGLRREEPNQTVRWDNKFLKTLARVGSRGELRVDNKYVSDAQVCSFIYHLWNLTEEAASDQFCPPHWVSIEFLPMNEIKTSSYSFWHVMLQYFAFNQSFFEHNDDWVSANNHSYDPGTFPSP